MKKTLIVRFFLHKTNKRSLRIMKNVIVLLFIVNFQLSASISGVSQNKVDLNLENTSLLECLREIEKQTDFGTLYNHKEMKEVKGLDVNLNDETIENALDHIFEKTDYTYIIKNRVILVKTKPQKNQLRTNTLQKEKPEIIKITGKVISDDGLPLPGVNVVVKDFPTIGSATNMDGNYSITVPSKAEVLIFSSVGMIAQEIKIEGKTVIDVELKTDMLGLKEVVVTGYSSISKERATGSFIKMKSKDLEEVHHLDVSKKIKYSAPGVLLSTKASDGGEETIIEMRGKATLKGSSSPLLVIDGFAVEAKLSQINPNDIETINILQDAAAASIWGARAANGVIVINTKKGSKADAPAIEFFYNTKVYQQPKVSDLQLASSRDVIDAHVEAMDKNIDYVVAGLIHPHNGTYERDVYLNPVQAIWCKHKANPQTYTLSMRNADLDKLAKNNVSDQYEDLLLQTGIAHDANLSIRGGNKRANYFLSYNYRNTKSVYVGDNTERNTITLNNGFKLNERIRLNTGVNLFFDNQEYNGVGLSYLIGYNNIPVYMPLQDASGNNTRYYYEGSKSVNTMKDYESRGYLPFGYNPYQIVLDNDNNRTSRNMRVNASLKYKIIDGLDWIVSGMYNTSSRKHENYSDYGAAKVNRLINKFSYFKTGELGNEILASHIPRGGILDLYQSNTKSYTLRSQINYSKTLEDNQINALIGVEFRDMGLEQRQREEVGYNRKLNNWALIDYVTLGRGDGVPVEIGSKAIWAPNNFVVADHLRFASYYLNAAYTYKNKYSLTLSGRIDDSNMFGVEASKRRTPLWSVGGSWNLNNEDFFNVSFVDRLKLRLTYGKNGNVNNSFSAFTILAFSRNPNRTTGEPFARISNLKNPNLKWETTATTNIAVDFALFSNQLWGSIEYYNRKSTDVLASFMINPLQGASNRTINNGEITNNGFTFSLSANLGEKFIWIPGVNISYNKNKVLKSESSSDPLTFLGEYSSGKVREGYSVDEVFGFDYAGLDKNGDPQIYDENGNIKTINDPVVKNIAAIHSLGVIRPKYWGAITNTFKYKNFSLHTIITFKLGHVFKRPEKSLREVFSGSVHRSIADRWKKPGDETRTDIPALNSGEGQQRSSYYRYSEANYLNASHIRFQDISLTYDLPHKLTKKIAKVQLRAQVSNVGLLWTANKENFDPEYVPFGSNNSLTQMSHEATIASRPGAKMRPIYSLGIKLNF